MRPLSTRSRRLLCLVSVLISVIGTLDLYPSHAQESPDLLGSVNLPSLSPQPSEADYQVCLAARRQLALDWQQGDPRRELEGWTEAAQLLMPRAHEMASGLNAMVSALRGAPNTLPYRSRDLLRAYTRGQYSNRASIERIFNDAVSYVEAGTGFRQVSCLGDGVLGWSTRGTPICQQITEVAHPGAMEGFRTIASPIRLYRRIELAWPTENGPFPPQIRACITGLPTVALPAVLRGECATLSDVELSELLEVADEQLRDLEVTPFRVVVQLLGLRPPELNEWVRSREAPNCSQVLDRPQHELGRDGQSTDRPAREQPTQQQQPVARGSSDLPVPMTRTNSTRPRPLPPRPTGTHWRCSLDGQALPGECTITQPREGQFNCEHRNADLVRLFACTPTYVSSGSASSRGWRMTSTPFGMRATLRSHAD